MDLSQVRRGGGSLRGTGVDVAMDALVLDEGYGGRIGLGEGVGSREVGGVDVGRRHSEGFTNRICSNVVFGTGRGAISATATKDNKQIKI
jgi:hypothetical protein